MKKLTRNEIDRLQTAASEITAIYEEMDQVRTHAEEELARLVMELSEPMETARGVLEDAANAAEEYYDERSEKWLESEAGEAYGEWKENLRRLADDLGEDIEPPQIGEVEQPDWIGEIAACDFAELCECMSDPTNDDEPIRDATLDDLLDERVIDDLGEVEDVLTEVVVAVDRMLNGMGKGRAPSPMLQEAVDRARALLPTIPPQVGPRDEP